MKFWIIFCLWFFVAEKKVECYYDHQDDPSKLINLVEAHLEVRNECNLLKRNEQLTCERPVFYICEESPDPAPVSTFNMCNYRNQCYQEQVYRWVAGRGCLLYTPNFLYVGGANTINLNGVCLYGTSFAPCLELPKEDGTCGCYPFDPGFEEVTAVVRQAIVPSAHGRWERCFHAAAQCCSDYMLQETNTSDVNQCETTFDGWTCWHAADVNTVATEVCSEFSYSGQGPSCHHYSSKVCHGNATWEVQTDYSACSITPRLLRRYNFYIAVLAFSVASCLPAVFVFVFYKRLRNNTRVALHRNLLIVIMVKNILVIVSRSVIYIDELTNSGETVMARHGVPCRLLAVAERVATNAVFVIMLVEGIYLHRLIVAVFKKKLNINILYGIGAVITIAPAAAWTAVMAVYDDHSCWLVYTVEHVQWVLDAPRVAILLVNTALFADVLRVLLTQVRNVENVNQLSTAKATLFLMPIFGIQFLLTAFRPNTTDCTWEQVYYYVSYTVESLQGCIVAMLYCYVNKEVHTLVKSTYRRAETAVVSAVRRDSNAPRSSMGTPSDRKRTCSTALPPPAEDKDVVPRSPNLHVAEIISIDASERLAEIIEPVYESVAGVTNEGFESIEPSDNDSEYIPNKDQEYYGFTNAYSVSFDCDEWMRGSPDGTETNGDEQSPANEPQYINVDFYQPKAKIDSESTLMSEERDDMLGEIMQYMENNEMSKAIMLDPNLLSPNRSDDDKIQFLDVEIDDYNQTQESDKGTEV